MLIVRARCIKKFVDPWANMAFTFLLMRRRLPSSIVERNPFKRKIFLLNFICKDSRLLDYLLFSVRVIFSRWKFSEKLKRKDYLYWIEFRIFFKYSFLRFPVLKNTFFFFFASRLIRDGYLSKVTYYEATCRWKCCSSGE